MKFLSFISLIFSIVFASEELKPFSNHNYFYTHQEVTAKFKDILVDDIQQNFNQFTAAFFQDNFGKSPHGKAGLVGCWNCLYNSMNKVYKSDKAYAYQLKELYHLLHMHEHRFYTKTTLYRKLVQIEEELQKLLPAEYEDGIIPALNPEYKQN